MRLLLLVFFYALGFSTYAQTGFQWKSEKNKIVIPFTFVDNLIIIPIEVNNTKLNMLLDSGSEPSLIFSFPENDSIHLFNTRKIKISGLGNEEIAEGLLSNNNVANIQGFTNEDFQILVILDEDLNFSSRIGIPVNGILGYSFFQNNLVEINYSKKKITIYKDRKILESNKLKSYTKLPVKIVKDRPYLDVKTKLDTKTHNLKLLIDTGMADGLWLFENDSIKSGKNYFEDVLGQGVGGTVLGKRSRLEEIQISKFKFSLPLVAYPDPTSYKQLEMVEGRDGSIGGGILKRFNVFIDYEGSQLLLKKNSMYNEEFNYNMSGIELQHNGVEWTREQYIDTSNKSGSNEKNIIFDSENFKYRFTLKPVFEIATIRKNSPAELAGLLAGDRLLKINGRNVGNLSKQKIDEMLIDEDGKKMELEIERKGKVKKFEFHLKKIL